MRTARPVSLLLVVSLLAALGACSSDHAPRAWATAVCKVLAPWRTEIESLTTRTQQQMSAATTPAQAKENLVRLFGGAEEASDEARAGVEKAGVPDVEQGEEIAKSFTASLAGVRDAYGKARQNIEGLQTGVSKDFYAHVTTVVDTLNSDYAASELDTSKLSSVELKEAFDEVSECR